MSSGGLLPGVAAASLAGAVSWHQRCITHGGPSRGCLRQQPDGQHSRSGAATTAGSTQTVCKHPGCGRAAAAISCAPCQGSANDRIPLLTSPSRCISASFRRVDAMQSTWPLITLRCRVVSWMQLLATVDTAEADPERQAAAGSLHPTHLPQGAWQQNQWQASQQLQAKVESLQSQLDAARVSALTTEGLRAQVGPGTTSCSPLHASA